MRTMLKRLRGEIAKTGDDDDDDDDDECERAVPKPSGAMITLRELFHTRRSAGIREIREKRQRREKRKWKEENTLTSRYL